jgi:hypothetical protein
MAYRIYRYVSAGSDCEDECVEIVKTREEVLAWAKKCIEDYKLDDKIDNILVMGQVPLKDVLKQDPLTIVFAPPETLDVPYVDVILNKLGDPNRFMQYDVIHWYRYDPHRRLKTEHAKYERVEDSSEAMLQRFNHGDLIWNEASEKLYAVSDLLCDGDYECKRLVLIKDGYIPPIISHAIEDPAEFYAGDFPLQTIEMHCVYHRDLLTAAAGRGRVVTREVHWKDGAYWLQGLGAPQKLDEATPCESLQK